MSYFNRAKNIQQKGTMHRLRPYIMPRLPLRDIFETERIILNRVERDEVIAEPAVLEYLTTNVVLPTYARKQIHDGTKWITWPEVPTDDYSYTKKGIDVDPDVLIPLLRAKGRGEIQWVVILADSPALVIQIQLDNRTTFDASLSDLYDVIGPANIPNLGAIPIWDVTNVVYAVALTHQERFTEMIEVRVYNPDVNKRQIRHVYIHLHFHEIAELYQKYPSLKDPVSRVTVY